MRHGPCCRLGSGHGGQGLGCPGLGPTLRSKLKQSPWPRATCHSDLMRGGEHMAIQEDKRSSLRGYGGASS